MEDNRVVEQKMVIFGNQVEGQRPQSPDGNERDGAFGADGEGALWITIWLRSSILYIFLLSVYRRRLLNAAVGAGPGGFTVFVAQQRFGETVYQCQAVNHPENVGIPDATDEVAEQLALVTAVDIDADGKLD